MLPEVRRLATVVVCEDDAPTLELLCDNLEADRYRPLPAPSAADALRLAQRLRKRSSASPSRAAGTPSPSSTTSSPRFRNKDAARV